MTDSSDITYDLSLLEKSMSAWKKSPGLRDYYASLYRDMADEGIGARPLEIGSGIAASREFLPRLTTSDIVKTPYVDRAVSAYDIPLPEAGNVWTSILALDVFHHMREPLRFIESASRALEPGGKIILMEPCASVFGRCFYSLFHVEPMERKSIEPPCSFEPNGPDSSYANMAIAYELVNRHREWFNLQLSQYGLKLSKVGYRDLFAYPLTGGYSKPAMAPGAVIRTLLRLEAQLPHWLLRWVGLRMIIVLTKQSCPAKEPKKMS